MGYVDWFMKIHRGKTPGTVLIDLFPGGRLIVKRADIDVKLIAAAAEEGIIPPFTNRFGGFSGTGKGRIWSQKNPVHGE